MDSLFPNVTPRSEEREQRRLTALEKVGSMLPKKAKPTATRLTEEEAEAWAAELNQEYAARMKEEETQQENLKMTESYNYWHTLDDNLSTLALLRGIHNIQENGGNSGDEKRFLDGVCDHFGHKRFKID